METSLADFVHRIVSASPELTAIYRQHIVDQDEVLPHVLMGEIARFVIASTASNESPVWRANLLQQLEAGIESGGSEVAEMIGVSFVEILCGENVALAALLPAMGDALRQEVRAICGV